MNIIKQRVLKGFKKTNYDLNQWPSLSSLKGSSSASQSGPQRKRPIKTISDTPYYAAY